MAEHRCLKYLEQAWVDSPVFFITACTHQRNPILANDQITAILVAEWVAAHKQHGWAVGRYMVMPDHVHFICAPVGGIADPTYRIKPLSAFMQQWKQWTGKLD